MEYKVQTGALPSTCRQSLRLVNNASGRTEHRVTDRSLGGATRQRIAAQFVIAQ